MSKKKNRKTRRHHNSIHMQKALSNGKPKHSNKMAHGICKAESEITVRDTAKVRGGINK